MNNDNFNKNKEDKSIYSHLLRHRLPHAYQQSNTIALMAILCLFMCVVGYEIIRENSSDLQEPEKKAMTKNPLIIREDSLANRYNFLSLDDDVEDIRLESLKEKSQLQKQKIRALKSALIETQQRSHEIKASLFCQKGDPLDKQKIQNLQAVIETKDCAYNELKGYYASLVEQFSELQNVNANLKDTQKALLNTIEQEKATSMQIALEASQEMEKAAAIAKSENEEIAKQIRLLEIVQTSLTDSIDKKNTLIDALQQELEESSHLIKAKNEEAENLQLKIAEFTETIEETETANRAIQSKYVEEIDILHSEFVDLFTQFEFEQTKNGILLRNHDKSKTSKKQHVDLSQNNDNLEQDPSTFFEDNVKDSSTESVAFEETIQDQESIL